MFRLDPIKSLEEALKRGLSKAPKTPNKPKQNKKLEKWRKSWEEEVCERVCERKVKYKSAQMAKNAIDHFETQELGLKLYYYKCDVCGKWHLTKKRQINL